MSLARRKFYFKKEIAEGGFGKVYLAEQSSADGFKRTVAIKLLHAKWSSHDEIVMRTRDEARLLGRISHPHIVKVEDLTSIDGKCAIVMEYLEGVDLKNVLQHLKDQNEVFPRAALFECMLGVASALHAAYNLGAEPLRVIHRDIKPSNIFVTVDGGVKVLDFGTARANFAEREAKTQALAFGSQGYMAPERMLGEEDTPAADVFSLGITLYELLTFESFGRIPPRPNKFQQKVQERVAAVVLSGDEQWQDQVRETLRSMLAYEPLARPSALQLIDIFETLVQNARDTGLRKFGRTSVAAAKAAEPEIQSGDPLTGSTVDEDASSAFGLAGGFPAMPVSMMTEAVQSGGSNQVALGAAALVATESVPRPNPPSSPSFEEPRSAPKARDSTPSVPPVSASKFDVPPVPSLGIDDGSPPKSKLPLIIGGAVVALVLGASVIGGLVYYLVYGSPTESGGAAPMVQEAPPAGDAAPTAVTGTTDAPVGGVNPTAVAGGVIDSKDSRTGVPMIPTVLKASTPEGAEFQISTGDGFKARWDGRADFDLQGVPPGSYRVTVTFPEGKKLRGKSFKVAPDVKGCAFTFDVATSEFVGECK